MAHRDASVMVVTVKQIIDPIKYSREVKDVN
jgi:hypothetical protein